MPGREHRGRRSLIILLVLLTVGVLALDQITKQLVVSSLELGTYHPIIGSVLGLSLVLNSGAAFSLAEGSTWLFTIAATVVTVVIIRVARRLGSRGWAVALGTLLGGTLGNLADRLLRDPGFAVGHVVDFINYNGWFVGNIADVAIVLSAAGIAVLSFRGVGVDGSRARPEATSAGTPAEGGSTPSPAETQGARPPAEGEKTPSPAEGVSTPSPAEGPEKN